MAGPRFSDAEKLQAHDLSNAARVVSSSALACLLECLEESGLGLRVYARKDRVKTPDDIEQKVIRKRIKRPEYGLSDVTDVGGLRFITLYRDDIAPVTEVILRALLGDPTDKRNPFAKKELQEFRFYLANARLESDPLALKLARIAKKLCPQDDPVGYEPHESERYSSVHFVAWVSAKKRTQKEALIRAPLEIQIRSVFEDAWGEVDHSLLYAHRRVHKPLEGALGQIERHSNALKKMMDAAADFADAMRSLGNPVQPPANKMRPTLDGKEFVEEVLDRIGTPEPIVEAVMALVERKDRLDDAIEGGVPWANRVEYARLATDFGELNTALSKGDLGATEISRGTGSQELFYILRVEEAVCWLLSNEERQVPLAVQRLTEVCIEYPDHPVAWFRLGEAYERLLEVLPKNAKEDIDEAKTKGTSAYERAAIAVKDLAKKNGDDRFFAASDRQEAVIRDNLARMHAFFIWRASAKLRGDSRPDVRSLEAARGAFRVTHYAISSVHNAEPRRRLLNGLVYYAAESIELARELGIDDGLGVPALEVRKLIEELERKLGSDEDGVEQLRTWDTVALAWRAFGQEEFAQRAAARVLQVLNSSMLIESPQAVAPYIREQQGLAMKRALAILRLNQPANNTSGDNI